MITAESRPVDSAAAINPRWVIATLKARGIVAPDLQATIAALSELDASVSAKFRAKIQRLNAGCESNGDMNEIALWSAKVREGGHGDQGDSTRTQKPSRCGASDKPRIDKVPRTTNPADSHVKGFEPSVHAYSSSAAICLELVEVRPELDDARNEAYWTLQIEMAKALSQRKFDWEKKIVFRLTKRELPLFSAVMVGALGSLQFANHGPGGDKKLAIEDQESHLYFDMRQGKKGIAMQVGGDEIFHLASLSMKALGRNSPHLDAQTVMALVKRAGAMYGAATAA